MKDSYTILAINPGSSSDKVSVFKNDQPVWQEVMRYPVEEVTSFNSLTEQCVFRKDKLGALLSKKKELTGTLDAVVGRGGLLRPTESGTYTVNAAMIAELEEAKWGNHASNLAAIIAKEIAEDLNIPAFIVDPGTVDEMDDVARLSGLPGCDRLSMFHTLNQKAVAHQVARRIGKPYESTRLIVAHLGGGITVGAHAGGRVIDVNDGMHGDGPFSPERAGGIPTGQLINLCYSGEYTKDEVKKLLVGKGGFVAYLGTNDGMEVNKKIDAGDLQAKLVYEAMIYQVAKEIGACAAVLSGQVDAVVITGGLAYDPKLVRMIEDRVRFIAEVHVIPGEDEMAALAQGALRVLKGEERAKEY